LHYKKTEIEAAKFRLNSKGAGCKPKLSFGRMLLTLVYLSQLHTFQYLGVQFELVSLLLIIFSLLVRYLLPASLLEQVKKKSGDFEWVEILTQYSLTVDSTEQPIERPSDREEQKVFLKAEKSYPKKSIYCSTKRRRHSRC